ncbi:MAG: cyanophycinase [Bacteroidetes bacterium]|nr:cyanophycinase [Bacteroidota bacterium]MBU1485753.1 cyanophycinase [Bacteroidota bacterium]MBU1759301.1 cyanophycinase [Bacteroidota bacterium]MBU2046079.1 cyanophycinase [Bacteroidota bacterium]MBU2269620.1 cyanophycinase [Bacteroidota bacterium]
MIRKSLQLGLIYILLFMSFTARAQFNNYPKGNLFIIGGGERSAELIDDLVKTAEMRRNDFIVVLPMATSIPDSAFISISQQLNGACSNDVHNFKNLRPNDPTWLDSIGTAKIIYIPGGDQNRFMDAVKNTPIIDAIKRAYKNGSTIAGTSAGAAVMSKYMITGNQLVGDSTYSSTFNKIVDKNIEFKDGLGLLDSVIIDQHFVKRSRYNRLISALNVYPNYDCIGIDESTAIVVHQNRIRVVGEGQVIKMSKPINLSVTDKGLIKFQDLNFSIFTNGDSFYLR